MARPRSQPDACPGALQVHQAADGALARVRLPGGVLTSPQIQMLAEAAHTLGNGELELTSRGNIQLRAVTEPTEFATRLADSGLLPSPTHERVRNILASPLSGRSGGESDVRSLVRELDQALCNEAALADLPGRVLFTLDDGRGDVTPLGGDFGIRAVSATQSMLVLAGCDTGVRVPTSDAVPVLIQAAHVFASIRDAEWRLGEIENGANRILTELGLTSTAAPDNPSNEPTAPIGWIGQDDGLVTLGGGLPFGVLGARLAEFLAAVERPLIVTPWKTVVLCDLTEHMAEQVVRVLAPMGLIFDENSPWLHVTACTGKPGCSKALADVRADVRTAIEADQLPIFGDQHWSGCERLCGRPRADVADIVATADGYEYRTP